MGLADKAEITLSLVGPAAVLERLMVRAHRETFVEKETDEAGRLCQHQRVALGPGNESAVR